MSYKRFKKIHSDLNFKNRCFYALVCIPLGGGKQDRIFMDCVLRPDFKNAEVGLQVSELSLKLRCNGSNIRFLFRIVTCIRVKPIIEKKNT